jgi:signal transduction histidine kinase
MKLSLRTTALVVSIVLCAVFIYQLYWLTGLYRTMNDQIHKNILHAMEIADHNELFHRLDQIRDNPELKGSIESVVSYNHDIDSAKSFNLASQASYRNENDSSEQSPYILKKDSNKIDLRIESSENPEGYRSFRQNARTTELLASFLQKSFHQAVDHLFPVNLAVYDSLLDKQLDSLGIREPHVVQLVRLHDDSVYASVPSGGFLPEKLKQYDYPFEPQSKYAYRLYMHNPNGHVIRQMGGILATSIMIFIVLIYIFFYLLKTIHRLQTEEELKTAFTNNMTHELKTPLAVAYAAVDALLVSDQPENREKRQKYLTIAKEQMMHLTGLVEQILSMSRKNNRHIELNREKIRLDELFGAVISRLKIITDKKVNFKTDVQPPDLTVYADKTHLLHILNNLIENGIKYSEEPASVIVQARKEGNSVSISVGDKGIGIDPKHQKRVFDKFYRVPVGNRHDVKGYGLGLFYVKEMAEKHGGSVRLESHPGKGSVFTIDLPQ